MNGAKSGAEAEATVPPLAPYAEALRDWVRYVMSPKEGAQAIAANAMAARKLPDLNMDTSSTPQRSEILQGASRGCMSRRS